jgi:hypothetical protein
LERVHFVKVILSALDKYIFFHPAKRYSIFSITPFQMDLILKGSSNLRPRHFIGKKEIAHAEY